eukprot:gene5011-8609_t
MKKSEKSEKSPEDETKKNSDEELNSFGRFFKSVSELLNKFKIKKNWIQIGENENRISEDYGLQVRLKNLSRSHELKRISNTNQFQKIENLLNQMVEIPLEDFNNLLKNLCSIGEIEMAEKWFKMFENSDGYTYSTMIFKYLDLKEFQKIENLFYEMMEKNINIKTNQMNFAIKRMLLSNNIDMVERLFKKLNILDSQSYANLIQAYLDLNNLERVEELCLELTEKKLEMKVVQFNVYIKRLIEKNQVQKVEKLFELFEPNGISYSILIHQHLKNNNLNRIEELFYEMIENNQEIQITQFNIFMRALLKKNDSSSLNMKRVENLFKIIDKVDEYSYSILAQANFERKNLKRVEEIFEEMIEKQISILPYQFSTFTKKMIESNKIEVSEKLFRKMNVHDSVSFTILIKGFLEAKQYDKVELLFDEMIEKNIEISIFQMKNFLHKLQGTNKQKKIKKYKNLFENKK